MLWWYGRSMITCCSRQGQLLSNTIVTVDKTGSWL